MTSDPARLRDRAEYALLRRAAATPAASSEDRAAILAGIAAGIAPAGALGTAKGGTVAASKTLLVGIGSIVAVGGIATAIVLSQPTAPPAPAHVATTVTAALVPSPSPSPAAPAGIEEAPAPVETATAAGAPPRSPPSVKPRASEPESSLAAESALVDRARASLDASPSAALALVEDHARRFPRGELAAERDFLRIKALRRLGRTEEARQHARAYAGRHPSSPYAPAVRTMLDELGGPR